MGSFSLDFPDALVFDILGDEVEVTVLGQGMVIVNIPFELTNDDDELSRRMASNEPIVPVQAVDAHLFVKGTIVVFDGNSYEFHHKHPEDANLFMVTLRRLTKTS